MLRKLRGNNSKGFTLIELMIVIAIIGILAAIAIPNFIAYRNKSFCSATESDANSIAGGLSDYFAIPTITEVPTAANAAADRIDLSREGNTGAGIALSGENTGTIGADTDPNNGITISVTDGSGRCPDDYQLAMDISRDPTGYWDGTTNVYYKIIEP
ncbi:MAG: prepilin-type N-terminal cleavage/methylation domain-containing protein [Desulfobacterales bacterium]|nr:prepilin-type N-terminal cleavage/methylation domain-containing protein [Desulfobacterales bacterium]